MEIGLLTRCNSIATDPLDQLQIDVQLLILDLTRANSYPDAESLAGSLDISLIAQEVVKVTNELNALKNGTTKDQDAYNSPECQNLLTFLNGHPFGDQIPSLMTLSTEGNYQDLAITIWIFKNDNLLTGKAGIIGQLQTFQLNWLQSTSP